jgi:tryptophan-rich sensory protein
MNVDAIIKFLYDLPLSSLIRTSPFLFPGIESVHVIAITLVVGSIIIVDLRLLGITSNRKPVTELSQEILPWTWGLFILAVISGSLMFISNATGYFADTPFRLKMVFLVLAGVNMAVFQFFTFKSVHLWDRDVPTLLAARLAGGLSITLWTIVVICGRWVGFTVSQGGFG